MPLPAPSARRLLAGLLLFAAEAASGAAWSDALRGEIERIDRETPGTLGVWVKRLGSGETFGHGVEGPWYLGSTVKVPIAIATLQDVDAGRLRLADRVTLGDADKIDGGRLLHERSGSAYTIDELLRRMLGDSDNTASNMLVRTIGRDRLNASARAAMGGKGFHALTSLTDVRRDVYAELHPDARELSNAQLIQIATARRGPERVEAVRRAIGRRPAELRARTIAEAYARYYRTRRNSASLDAYGTMLERLVKGELLGPASTALLFARMKLGIYTNYRLQAGLPRGVGFIHKTGTQYHRACHAGVIAPEAGGAQAIVVAACTADIDEMNHAGTVLERVGRAITRTVLAEAKPPRRR
jgi:beta-lactamase class A